MTQFTDFALHPALLKALETEGYTTPTPIQAQTIPLALAGRDIVGIAQTGTGKTAAFALPILDHLHRNYRKTPAKTCRALILAPTRELAAQIAESFRVYGASTRLTTLAIYGGVGLRGQEHALAKGPDILVATPGRLLDQIERGALTLREVEMFVLDEADQMLDLGFIHPLKRIAKLLPAKRRSLFFSATMPKTIESLAAEFLSDPAKVAVTPVATTAERVEQKVLHLQPAAKPAALEALIRSLPIERALIFSRTKHGADKVGRKLEQAGIKAGVIHGNKSQGQRERTLAAFRDGSAPILIATDIAARGIDVDGVSHVFNYDLPNVPESYVHRIGRTARAGASGLAISFCAGEERAYLRDIEKLIRQRVPEMAAPEGLDLAAAAKAPSEPREAQGARPDRPQHERPRQDRPRHDRPHRDRPANQGQGERRRDETPRDDQRAAQPRRDTRPQPAHEPHRGEPRRDQSRRDETRRDQPRRDQPRREEPRRADHRDATPQREARPQRAHEPRRDDRRVERPRPQGDDRAVGGRDIRWLSK